MNIDRKKLLMPFKELLPEWCHWQGSLGEEHEGNLRSPLKRIILVPRNKRSPPEEFGVIHGMQQIGWRPNPTFYSQHWLLKARLERRLHQSHVMDTEMPNHVHAKKRSTQTNNQKQQEELQKSQREGPRGCSSQISSGSRVLPLLQPRHHGFFFPLLSSKSNSGSQHSCAFFTHNPMSQTLHMHKIKKLTFHDKTISKQTCHTYNSTHMGESIKTHIK